MQKQRQIQTKVYGNATFKITVDSKIIQQKTILNVLNNPQNWKINFGLYIQNKWCQVFPHMVKCQVQAVYLNNNQQPQMIKYIQNVQFINLRFLMLSNNSIKNIESLNFISCQNLQFLSLGSNYISQVKCMNKLKMSCLKGIGLSQNPIHQISSLSKAKFHQNEFSIALEIQPEQNEIHEDLSVFFKLSSQSFAAIIIRSQIRINQPKLQRILIKKCQSVLINPELETVD